MFEQCNNLISIKTELKKSNYLKLIILYAPKLRKKLYRQSPKIQTFKKKYCTEHIYDTARTNKRTRTV